MNTGASPSYAPRVGRRRGLLVAGHDVGHLALARVGGDLVLQQRLADAGYVAMPELPF